MNDILERRGDMKKTRRWAFKDVDRTKCKQVHFQEIFFQPLEEIKGRTALIGYGVDTREEYGLSRSFWRGSTEPTKVDLNNYHRFFFIPQGKDPQ